ncbi:MAG: DUF3160 domain-containing protein [Patescibacteria group bacterium]|nr:DUF3160 domain-containing protein [Patescibacteria group bacterium]
MQIQKEFGFSKITLIILITFLVGAGIIGGIFYWQKKEVQPPSQPPLVQPPISPSPSQPVELAVAKRLIKSEDIVLEKVDVVPQIPKYNLPLKTEDISNWQKFSKKIQLNPKALSLLEKNGFVVIPTPKEIGDKPDDFVEFYSTLKAKDLPIFITTDSLLHYYHIFFDTTLMKLEKDLFYPDVWQMSKDFFDDALLQYSNTSGDLKEAAKRNLAYFSVALELLKPKSNQVATKKNIKKEIDCYGPEEYCDEIISTQLREGKFFNFFNEQEAKKYTFEVPNFVKDLVQKEIELIEKHEGWKFSPIFVYKEDYSQYVPRGHYTKSEKLKNYFKAMMWYGRMTALIKGSPVLPKGESMCTGPMNGIVSEYDAKIQTLQASLIANKFSQSKDIQGRWTRMYAITGFFVGFSDDLGPYEYSAVLKSLFGGEVKSQNLEEKYSEVRDTLLNLPYNPKIYGGLGACELFMPCPPLSDTEIQELKVQAKKLLEETKGFRLMGQRFTIDSWLFSEIVSPYSGEYTGEKLPLPTDKKPFTFTWDDPYFEYRKNRPFTWVKTEVKTCPSPAEREVKGFPRSLDIMALFGSKRAKEILEDLGDTKYSDYEKKFSELKQEIDSLSIDDWFKNLYWNWLYVLRSLLDEFGEGYQTFMQTKAWQDKELNTALASWSELRHDTILYVKQSYTMAEKGGGEEEPPIVGYVEPVPEFYARLLTLTKMTNKGLKGLVPQEELEKLQIEYALDRFSEILSRLLEISKKELENKKLTEDEYYFIESFGSISEGLIKTVSEGEVDPDIFKTVLIADVHTEDNTKKVLEEGVGYIKTLVVAYKLPEGHILVGVGPVFSYYEFKQPMERRLTDEAWRGMLDSKHPLEPEWIKSFSE